MRMHTWHRSALAAAGAVASFLLLSPAAQAQNCTDLPDYDASKSVFGAGGSAVTPTLRNVARALASLPAESEDRIRIFYADPGACTGYAYWRAPGSTERSFRYWDAGNTEHTCQAPETILEHGFAHMGNTPAMCPTDVPLLAGQARFVAPVQTVNFITHASNTQYLNISAEALYHIWGFRAGTAGRTVAPWDNFNGVQGRAATAFVTQLIAGSIGVPATTLANNSVTLHTTNGEVVNAVFAFGNNGDVNEPIGFVSGSNAQAGEFPADPIATPPKVKTLAYQHYDQSCAYLPDSQRGVFDKANVRNGQYWIWTPAWFYGKVDGHGAPVDDNVAKLIGWFDGTRPAPGDLDIQKIVVDSGDIPLCAMHAMRAEGDLSPIGSYAPANPCNGWYELTAKGSTDYTSCTTTADCEGEQTCRFGYCEAY